MNDDYTTADPTPHLVRPQRVGIGWKADGYDDGDLRVAVGDYIVFSDPDAGNHADGCELVSESVTVGFVRTVYAHERDGEYAIEVSSTAAGRVSVTDRHVAIIPQEAVGPDGGFDADALVGGMDATEAGYHLPGFVDSEYDKHRTREVHMGRDGVPDGLWAEYDEGDRSGPGCAVCTGDEGTDGVRITGE